MSVASSASTQNQLDPNRWRALMVIAIAQLMVVLDASIVNIALPSLQADLPCLSSRLSLLAWSCACAS